MYIILIPVTFNQARIVMLLRCRCPVLISLAVCTLTCGVNVSIISKRKVGRGL